MALTIPSFASGGPVQDRTIGRVLCGRYRVISRLGEGGMGAVYLCEHAVLGRRYALKVLRPELSQDPELAERFRNEAIAASRIGGDNVVDVLDFGQEDDGALYYVMEALDGKSLGAIVAEEGPLGVDRVLGLLEQICHALGAAHARGVVHRDVKPDNVFVVRRPDGTEQAKVIDFGISQVPTEDGRERLTRAGSIIGTPEYMAPEQASGEPVDHRADVYALGVLAYELLTGTLPILAHTPVATLVAHQTRNPEPPSRRRSSVSPEVDALVLKALAKRPEDRPATMEAFAEAIARIRQAKVAAEPAPPPARSTPRPRDTVALPAAPPRRITRRQAAALLAAAVVAGAGGLLYWARLSPRSTAAVAEPKAAPSAPAAPASIAAGPSPAPSPAAPPSAAPAAALAPPSRSAAATPSVKSPGAASTPAPARRPSGTRSPKRAESHLDDPYSAGALKSDPFQ